MNPVKTVVVVGAGFAGLAAARRLGRCKSWLRTVVIDPRKTSDFLPLLPDIVGGRISRETTQYPLDIAMRRFAVERVQDTVQSIDVPRRIVRTSQSKIVFDYLVLACGSVTDFHGTDGAEAHAFTVKSARDAGRLARALNDRRRRQIIVCGGGYTGIEIATHVKTRFGHAGDDRPVLLLEAGDDVLNGMPDVFRRYAKDNLSRMNIETLSNTTIKNIAADGLVRLSNGVEYESALVAWSAGVKIPPLLEGVELATGRGGRIKVDSSLQFAPGCFAAGDAACVERQGTPLRMGIQFSLVGGDRAAENVGRLAQRRPMRAFNPIDPGYVIPMANNRSCGKVLGVSMYGRTATLLHYFMCGFRTWGARHRGRLLAELLHRGTATASLEGHPDGEG